MLAVFSCGGLRALPTSRPPPFRQKVQSEVHLTRRQCTFLKTSPQDTESRQRVRRTVIASLVASRMLISSMRRLPTSDVAQITPGLSVNSLYRASRSLCCATYGGRKTSGRVGEATNKTEENAVTARPHVQR